MSDPLSEIKERRDKGAALTHADANWLIAEVERLRKNAQISNHFREPSLDSRLGHD